MKKNILIIGTKLFKIVSIVIKASCIILSMFNLSYAIIDKKLLICGVCQNVESRILHSIRIIESIGSLFKDYKVIVYENNSIDKTVQILREWENKNKHIKIYSENLSKKFFDINIVNKYDDNKYFRPELIARARNFVLDKIMSDKYHEYEYVIWMDLDFKIMPRLEGIVEVFESKKEWDAVFANGINRENQFWDWYALRDNVDPLGPELLGYDWFIPKKLRLDLNDDWYPVYSAFGGCGIYKKSSIVGCRYSALVTSDLEQVAKKIIDEGLLSRHVKVLKYINDIEKLNSIFYLAAPSINLRKIKKTDCGIKINDKKNALVWRMNSFVYQYPVVCEHVTFHASMILNGYDKLFINPRMVFTYGG